MSAKQHIEAYRRARAKRDQMASLIDDAYEFALPQRQRITGSLAPGSGRMDRVFDATAIHSTKNFASRMLFGVFPQDAKTFLLQAGDEVPEGERHAVDQALAQVTDIVVATIAGSQFHTQAHEAFLDLAVGTAVLRVDDGDAVHPIRVTAIPLTSVVIDEGPFGAPDIVYLPRQLKAAEIAIVWPEAAISGELADLARDTPEALVELVELVKRDWTDKGNESWIHAVIDVARESLLVDDRFSEQGSCPLIVFRWSVAAGEVYGRGPLLDALPDIKTLNLEKQLVLENADLATSGMWTAEDDGVVNVDTIRLVPGSIIPIAAGSKGLQPLQSPARFDVAQLIIEDLQAAIKRALYDEDLGPPIGTPMSATEVVQRTADRAERVGAPFGRLLEEFLFPVVRRVVHILKRRGQIRLPTIDGRTIRIVPLSPLARAQAQEEVMRHDRALELVTARCGPQVAMLAFDLLGYAAWVGRQMGFRPELTRQPGEQQQLVTQMAQAAQDPAVQAATGGLA